MALDPTVFLIADDDAVRDALSISLIMDNLSIEVYLSGKAFLDAYNGDRPGCLLMDLSLPELDCLGVQAELIRRNLPIPIVFLTGIGTLNDSVLAMKSGAFCLLEKPVARPLLLKRLHEAMQQDLDKRLIKNNKTEERQLFFGGFLILLTTTLTEGESTSILPYL